MDHESISHEPPRLTIHHIIHLDPAISHIDLTHPHSPAIGALPRHTYITHRLFLFGRIHETDFLGERRHILLTNLHNRTIAKIRTYTTGDAEEKEGLLHFARPLKMGQTLTERKNGAVRMHRAIVIEHSA